MSKTVRLFPHHDDRKPPVGMPECSDLVKFIREGIYNEGRRYRHSLTHKDVDVIVLYHTKDAKAYGYFEICANEKWNTHDKQEYDKTKWVYIVEKKSVLFRTAVDLKDYLTESEMKGRGRGCQIDEKMFKEMRKAAGEIFCEETITNQDKMPR